MLKIKEKTRKTVKYIINVLILLVLVLNSSSMVIANEIVENLQTGKAEATIETELTKYSNYNVHEQKGSIVQLNVKTGIKYPENVQTNNIKKSIALLNMPLLKEEFPERVEVIAKSTKATNGKEKEQVSYAYDKNTGALQITTSNEENAEYVANSKDEYEIIAIYSENTYEEQDTKQEAAMKIAVQEYLNNQSNDMITETQDITLNLQEKASSVISSKIEIGEIFDGYLKANRVNGTAYETTYQENANILVSNKELEDTLEIKQENQYLNENSEIVEGQNGIIYKSTKINKQNVLDILGEEGSLKVLKEDGTIIKEINKDTEEDVVEIAYEENTNKIVIQTSKPQKEGEISIEHTKAFPVNVESEKISKIKTQQTIESSKEKEIENTEGTTEKQTETQELGTQEAVKEIQQSGTNVEMAIDNSNLTNEAINDVTITAILQSNSAKYGLYKNPKIQIELPEEVEKVVLGDVSVLYTDELSLKDAQVTEKNGKKVLTVELTGTQTKYIEDSINKGIDIIIPAKLILKSDIESKEQTIITTYSNETISGNKYVKEEKNANEIKLNISAIKTEVKNQEESKLDEEAKVTPTKTNTIQSEDIELNSYAQIGKKKISNGDSIHDTEIIKYVVEIKNTTDTQMKNININCQIPEGTQYATINRGTYYEEDYTYEKDPSRKEYTFTAETLNPGETKTGFYEVVVDELAEGIEEKTISNKIVAVSGEQEIKSVTLENKIVKAKLKVDLKSYIGRDSKNSFYYFLDITNTSNEDLKNIELTSNELQKEMNIIESKYYEDTESPELEDFGKFENNILSGVISGISAGQTRSISIKVKTQNFDENVNEVPISMSFEAKLKDNGNEIYYSNENRRTSYPEYVTVQMTADKEGEEVKPDEIITYKVTIKNPSKIRTYIEVEDILPEDVKGIELNYNRYVLENDNAEETQYDIEAEANIKYTIENQKRDLLNENLTDRSDIDEYLVIPAGKSVEMTFTAQTRQVATTREVSNYVTVKGNNIKTVTSNIVKFTLVSNYNNGNNNGSDDNNNNGDNGNNQNPNNNSISGVVWKDENKDGKRDSNEQFISGVKVKLYNVDTKALSKKQDGTAQEIQTDSNGAYKFTNIENGNYWVLFEYDTGKYGLTAYKKSGVSEDSNSDVVDKQVSVDGIEKKVGMTDTLSISNSSYSNIDMGLISNDTFDLRLDKYISKINLNIPNGNKQYSYDNTQFAKIEIKSKQIKNAIITIEYKIKVTNEGNIEGYASKIADYIPNGYTFDASQNKGWIKNNDGSVTNTSLSSEFIKPGESKELTLVLKKQLTENDTGSIKNVAEIAESRNVYNISDKDSTPGNKNAQEDDYSEAEILISIETGIAKYTIITIISLVILALVVFAIKKNLFSNKKIGKGLKLFVMLLFVTGVMTTQTFAGIDIRTWYDSNKNRHFYENGTATWGTEFFCLDSGYHQCAYAYHYYNYTRTDINHYDNWSGAITNKSVTISSNEQSADTVYLDSDSNLVGPYTIKSNADGTSISSIKINYMENGQSKESTNAGRIVNLQGNSLNLGLSQNQDYTFYIKVSKNTEKINSINIKLNTTDAYKYTQSYSGTNIYTCYDVQSGRVHSHSSGFGTASAAKTQRMGSYASGQNVSYSGKTDEVNFGEILIKGNLQINKTDETTGTSLNGVEFTMKMLDGKMQGQYVGIDNNGTATYSSTPQTLKTDNNGRININLMYPGNYELVETANPHYGYEDLPKTVNSSLYVKAGGTTTASVTNKRKYIDLSGYVWEDMPWKVGKEETSNELYQDVSDDKNDKKLENVIVRLKEGDNIVSEATTDSNGNYTFKKIEIDKLNGYYIEFEYNGMSYQSVDKIDLNKSNASKAKEGTARDTFNNKFTTIRKGESADENGNKTSDLKYNVENNKSTIILGDNLKYGYSGAKNPVNGVYSQYLIKSNTNNAYGGNLDRIKTADQIRQEAITELTNINLGLKEREQPDIAINKDLYSTKVQVGDYNHIYNYADRFTNIATDENATDPTVKFGQKYGNKSYTRALYASDIQAAKEGKTRLAVNVIYEISLKNESTNLTAVVKSLNEYYDSKYSFVKIGNKVENGKVVNEIDSFNKINNTLIYDIGDVNGDGEVDFLDATMILRYVRGITTFNEEQKIKADFNQDGVIDETDARMILEYDAEIGDNDKNYRKNILNANIAIPPQSEQKIYLELKVKPDQVYQILDKGIDVKLDNIVEIASYGVLDKDSYTYAGIDQDSQPGNTNVTDQTTWEDDTDKAPGLLLKLQEERKTKGMVFEDDTDNGIVSGQTRQGDGKYDTTQGSDKGINGVTVRLVDDKTGKTAQVYDKENNIWKDAIATTANDGKYEIGGFLPGKYHLEYTWGGQTNKDGSGNSYIYRVQNYKSTVVDEKLYTEKKNNLQWYKIEPDTRYSDALDNYETRQKIDEQGQDVTNGVQHSLKDYKDNDDGIRTPNDTSIISTMTSTTPNFEVNLEYNTDATNSAKDEYELNKDGSIKIVNGYPVKKEGYKNELKNIDFGIARRAKQQLSLEKYVKEAKVVLADGNVLIDAKINSEGQLEDTVKYVSYAPKVAGGSQGQLKIEIDSELIQSATLEITYGFKIKNTSEIDYATEDYYYYGNGHGESNIITLTPKELIDYADNNLSTTDAENWSIIDGINNKNAMTRGENRKLEDTDTMRTYLNSVNRILLYTVPENEQKALKPIGDDSETTFDVELKATKLLANNSDETFMENNAEIIEVGKTGGSILVTTPGNYIPGNTATYEADSSTSESLVILPPTGLSTNTIAWIMLALSSLGILTTGIILIKKYVLKK